MSVSPLAVLMTVIVMITGGMPTPPVATVAPSPMIDAPDAIERIDLVARPLALDVLLSDAGLDAAGTCEGAAGIAADLVERYPALPGATGDIAWAYEHMTREIYGHGRAAAGVALPGITDRANPVSIVFDHYTDPALILRDRGAWTLQRAYATLYRLDCR